MNISNELPKTTQKDFLEYKIRSDTFAYRVGNGIYLNITNRCTNDCVFCLRNNGNTAYGSDSLWLKREPTPQEVVKAVEEMFFERCTGFVFCGYGEPTCRFNTLIETARLLKSEYIDMPIRLNTNGQSELINGKDSTERLFGLIDSVSISLNSSNSEDYDKLCCSVFGESAYEAMFEFGKRCVGNIPDIQFSVVEDTLSNNDIEICRNMVHKIGARLRIRKFISENDKNPE